MVMSDPLLLKQRRSHAVCQDALDRRKVPATEALLEFEGLKLDILRHLVDHVLSGPLEVDLVLWDLFSPHRHPP